VTDVKKQHYVPQFYLKRFASNTETLYAFNKFTRKSFRTNVRDVASEMRFYDIHPDLHKHFLDNVASGEVDPADAEIIAKARDPQFIEHELAAREATFSPIYQEVLNAIEGGRRFTDAQRWYMAEFVSMQYLRTPESRKTNIDFQKSALTTLFRKFSEYPDAYVEYDERNASLDHAQMMFNPDLMSQLCLTLVKHIWLIGENVTSHHFYTSDSPVVKKAHIRHPFMGVGIGSFGVEVAFPLTPKYMLIMCERAAFIHLADMDERTIPLTSEHITYYNSLQVLQSYRSIYSLLGEFLLAVEICAEHPEVCVPERIRVETS
jgi:hypothetical protein